MTIKSIKLVITLTTLFLVFVTNCAHATDGPYPVISTGYYQFLARDEPLVATDRKVDLWAQIYRPNTSVKSLPVVIFLHGNHGTCGKYDPSILVRRDDRIDYTDTGKCPSGYVVTPNHLGYSYMAEQLASYGYMVVSINANRGITAGSGVAGDSGLNLMRGRLVLRHLALLSGWNRGTGPITPPVTLKFNPVGSMDFSQLGLMGHSRGGEGVRAALQQLRDAGSPFPALIPNVAIRSIFEIGPVDGQTYRTLDANGVNSMILLPACDGDVSNLQGMKVFDRVIENHTIDPSKTFHGTVYVWGADHDAYNTEWQQADSTPNNPGCIGTLALFPANGVSKPQQITARDLLVPFFRATLGAGKDLALARIFNPTNPAPETVTNIANVDRNYLPSPLGSTVQLITGFSKPTGTPDPGTTETAVAVTVVHQAASFEHDVGIRVATVTWTKQSAARRTFEVGFQRDVSADAALSFRTALRCFGMICQNPASDRGEMIYSVSLVDANGQVSNPVPTNRFVRISRPLDNQGSRSTLYTVEMPISLFQGVTKSQIRGVRFTFGQPEGIVDITDLTFMKADPLMGGGPSSMQVASSKKGASPFMASMMALSSPSSAADGNTIKIVRQSSSGQTGQLAASKLTSADAVSIVLTSNRSFPVTDAFPKLTVGKQVVQGGTISPDGKTMTINVPAQTFAQLPGGADVSLFVRASSPVWKFGKLPK